MRPSPTSVTLGWVATSPLATLALKTWTVGLLVLPYATSRAAASLAATTFLACLLGAALALTRERTRLWTALGANLLCTVVLLADVWHIRHFGDALSVSQAGTVDHLPSLTASLRVLTSAWDVWLFADIALIAGWTRRRCPSASPVGRRRLVLASCAGAAASLAAVPLARPDVGDVLEYEFSFEEVASTLGLAGYHALDASTAFARSWQRAVASDTDVRALHQWLRERSGKPTTSPLFGAAHGRNVILVSAESLPAFAIGLAVDGQPIAPHFSAFAAESLHFTEYYDQTHRGTTSDAEFMALNSLLPLRRGTVATHFKDNVFAALPGVLRERGYATFSACGEPPSFWNIRHIHERYGFERSMFLPDFRAGEMIGTGLADDVFFAQAGDALATLPEPFFAFLLTASNHHPWKMPPARRRLHLPSLAGTQAEDYLQSIQFADDAFGQFVADLRRRGLLDRSMLVVYGDHRAWLEDGTADALWRAAGQSQPLTNLHRWQFERRVPLFVHLPRGAAAGVRAVPGSHIDIAPTVGALLGLRDVAAPWLGHDLTSPAPRRVAFRDGEVTTGQATVLATGDTLTCTDRDGVAVSCEPLLPLVNEGRHLFEQSDRIIEGDLAGRLAALGRQGPRIVPSPAQKVLAIAHRGDSLHFPENTAAAVRGGFDAGADIVEIDVRRTADGVPVVFHDDTLERTSNGRGAPEALTLRAFKSLDAGGWMHPRFRGMPPITLAEAVRLAQGRGRLYLDIKNDGIAKDVAAVFDDLGVTGADALVGVWTAEAVDEFRREMPSIPLVRVVGTPTQWPASLFAHFKAQGLWGIELGDHWPAAFLGDAARQGLPVLAYTVNDAQTMARLVEMGARGIETDDPALLVSVLQKLRVR